MGRCLHQTRGSRETSTSNKSSHYWQCMHGLEQVELSWRLPRGCQLVPAGTHLEHAHDCRCVYVVLLRVVGHADDGVPSVGMLELGVDHNGLDCVNLAANELLSVYQ